MSKTLGQLLASVIDEDSGAIRLVSDTLALEGAGTPVEGVEVTVKGNSVTRQLVFQLTDFVVTLVKNGTSSGGGGTKFFDCPPGLILPVGVVTDLELENAGDGNFVGSIGTAAAGTDGTLSGTEANIAPSTAATITGGVGTCKMKSTVSVPAPGAPLDGVDTPIDLYLNFALGANATGKETMTVNGRMVITLTYLGDN